MHRLALVTTVALSALALMTATAHAHEQEFGSANLAPRIGRMSDEVILQRLQIAGVESPSIVSRRGDNVIARGLSNGREVRLEVQALSGKVFELNARRRTQIIGAAIVEANPMIRGVQIAADRERLADPALMREALEPERLLRPR